MILRRRRYDLAVVLLVQAGLALAAQAITPLSAAPSTVQLMPGAPPSRVVGWVGQDPKKASPQVAAKLDPTAAVFSPDPAKVALGRQVFFDTQLSAPRGMSCATCHDPSRAFTPSLSARALAGPGTPEGSRPKRFSPRNAPSLLYARYIPRRHFYQDDDAPYAAPFGGLMLGGHADTLAEQVSGPLLNPNEMNNGTAALLLRKVNQRGWANDLATQFGPEVRQQPQALIRALGEALQAYLQSDEMAPFSSRFDDYLRHKTALAPAEMRGLALFKNPDKGNCMSCHAVSDTASKPERSLFTDFGYDAIAVPRNRSLPANQNPRYFDNGLCQTAGELNWPKPDQWCGYWRTPSLRNVAVRQRLMHNSVFNSLREAVAFYNTRSIDPGRWYKRGRPFDDVPSAYLGNVNVNSPPMNRKPGMPVALTDNEIDDIVALLRTLTDAAYVAKMPGS